MMALFRACDEIQIRNKKRHALYYVALLYATSIQLRPITIILPWYLTSTYQALPCVVSPDRCCAEGVGSCWQTNRRPLGALLAGVLPCHRSSPSPPVLCRGSYAGRRVLHLEYFQSKLLPNFLHLKASRDRAGN
jgi:hypothetical protein